MIKNVVFDIGGVLIDFDPMRVLKEKGLFGDDLKKVLTATIGNPLWRELDRGVMKETDVIGKMKEGAKGLEEYIDWFFSEGVKEVVTLRDYSMSWFKALKERGQKIYLLSNYPTRLFEMHQRAVFDFLPLTDGRIVSGYVKVIKPDEAIYKMLLEKYLLKASECIFIDDMEENVKTAERLGMHGVHFTGYDTAREKVEKIIDAAG